MQTRRIGPGSPGVSRLLGARLLLVLVAGFYLAGMVFVFLYAIGEDPFAHDFGLSWPWGWLSGIWSSR